MGSDLLRTDNSLFFYLGLLPEAYLGIHKAQFADANRRNSLPSWSNPASLPAVAGNSNQCPDFGGNLVTY